MWHNFRIAFIGLLLGFCSLMRAAEPLSEQSFVWLITCTPGDDLYNRYGHTAIRVSDPVQQIDAVFNYGTFDFNTEHFYWKFMRGQTWYELGVEIPYYLFERHYLNQGRKVYWQELNLRLAERQALWDALCENALEQNKAYLYNFVFDNCATRPYHMIKNACTAGFVSDYEGYKGCSYRSFLRHYTGSMSYANAGINLLFGPVADRKMNDEQRLFLPEELMNYMQHARRADNGAPMVAKSHTAAFAPPYTPWYASWPVGLVAYFLFVFAMSWYDHRRGKWSRWVEIVAAVPYVLVLLIVGFLTFFSCHPLVGFGWRLLIIPLTHLCARLIYIIRW